MAGATKSLNDNIGPLAGKHAWKFLGFALVALVIGIIVGALKGDHGHSFYFAYHVGWLYGMSLVLGMLFFTVLHHLARAGWSALIRRVAELVTTVLPWMFVLGLPLVLPVLWGKDALFHWANPELFDHDSPKYDHIIDHKEGYLNGPFFVIRYFLYFFIWGVMARFYFKGSVAQDTATDTVPTARMERISPLAMILFALSLTFFSFDLIMSLDAHWFSTIFGVYFFAGCVITVMATLILIFLFLQKNGYVQDSVTAEHYHDLGKYLFAFVFFWGYIAFSQYMLIWYANIPEETVWVKHRSEHGWGYVSMFLVFGHFAIPFLGLLSRHFKRNTGVLKFWCVWMLFAHGVDLFWLVVPCASHGGAATLQLPVMELCCMVGFYFLVLALAAFRATKVPLVAKNDPRLNESLAFENI